MKKQVFVTPTFFESWKKLNNEASKQVQSALALLADGDVQKSLRIHDVDRVKGNIKFKTASANMDVRIIFVEDADSRIILYTNHHDAAYSWCEGKDFRNTDFGLKYVYDEKKSREKIDRINAANDVPEYLKAFQPKPLFEQQGIREKDLVKLGVEEMDAQALMQITDEDALIEFIEDMPVEITEALIDLSSGTPFETVYNNLLASVEDADSANQSRFYPLDMESLSDEERQLQMQVLEQYLGQEDFEKWTLFLHPSQKKLVETMYDGPMLVEGGPGTGKTVVGMHRALYLSQNHYRAADQKKVLICTYSVKLAKIIEEKIKALYEMQNIPAAQQNIDVLGVDSYISQTLGDRNLRVDMDRLDEIIRKVADQIKEQALAQKWDAHSFEKEYYEVIDRMHVETLEDYLKVDRTGSGNALTKGQREEIWPYLEQVLRQKKDGNVHSYVDRAYLMKALLDEGQIQKKYDAIIIDEAQDLEGIRIQVLCESIKAGTGNICILSDENQRIFQMRSWKMGAGVEIKGRSHRLRINYRTTKQIHDYAREQFSEMELVDKVKREYISLIGGEAPEVKHFVSEAEENREIVKYAKKLLEEYQPYEICIVAGRKKKLKDIQAIFDYEDIPCINLTGNDAHMVKDKINLCTTKGVKGLEFAAVILANYNMIGTDMAIYQEDSQAKVNFEKMVECEKYVALTRARDKVIITYVNA